MTIAEWFLWFTKWCGHNFNNATMTRECNDAEDLVTGNLLLWLFVIALSVLATCLVITLFLKEKEEKKFKCEKKE